MEQSQYPTTSMPMHLEGASMPMLDTEDPADKPVTEAPTHLRVPDDPSAVTDMQTQTDMSISTAGANLQMDLPANDIAVPTISYGN